MGGVLLGMGLVLHGQVAMAHYIRREVDSTFFLWRWIGELTFAFQDTKTKVALMTSDLQAELIREADRGAWTLVAIGMILAATAFLIRRPQRAGAIGGGVSWPRR